MNRPAARMSLLAVALALGAGAATAAELQATVPPRFQGEWAASLKQCGTGDESRLTIEPAHIRFYESRGAIKAVVTQGDSELALIAELSGEGETWLSPSHFRLAADQKTLADVTGEPAARRPPSSSDNAQPPNGISDVVSWRVIGDDTRLKLVGDGDVIVLQGVVVSDLEADVLFA